MSTLKNPKISVIVPVYNVEKYLQRCVDSILAQSFVDFELLLVDDGSPDNCGKICDDYKEKDKRVRVFHKPNGGVSSARNLGLDNALGEWIAFIDSDDYVDIDYLSELIESQKLNNTDFVVTLNTIKDYSNDLTIFMKSDSIGLLFSHYNFLNYGSPWAKLYNLSIIRDNYIEFNPNIRFGEDLIFAMFYLLQVKTIQLVYSSKYFWERQRPDSLTKQKNSYDIEYFGKIEFEKVADMLLEKYNLDSSAQDELNKVRIYYTERVLSSISNLSSRRQRIHVLKSLELSTYFKYKKPYSWKEGILILLLKVRCYNLYDFCILFHRLIMKI